MAVMIIISLAIEMVKIQHGAEPACTTLIFMTCRYDVQYFVQY